MDGTTAKVTDDAAPSWAFPRLSAGRVGLVVLLVIAFPCILTLPRSISQYDRLVALPRLSPMTKPKVGVAEQNISRALQNEAMAKRAGDAAAAEESRRQLAVFREDLKAAQAEPWQTDEWIAMLMGTDAIGRSLLWRSLLGGAISLGVGVCAATISVVIGVLWGATAGLAGGRVDSAMMRIVDILYGLPYILLVVLVKIALQPAVAWAILGPGDFSTPESTGWLGIQKALANQWAAIITLLIAIGGVSWLTMARVIRGQVLSLRAQPFVEAARACGVGPVRILRAHLLPNLVGPIVVYTTLTVPTAILQESFLSFLGIGIQLPLPSWGNLASEGVKELHALTMKDVQFKWWLAFWPCALLGMTLLALNFLGDALRNRLDPRRLKK